MRGHASIFVWRDHHRDSHRGPGRASPREARQPNHRGRCGGYGALWPFGVFVQLKGGFEIKSLAQIEIERLVSMLHLDIACK